MTTIIIRNNPNWACWENGNHGYYYRPEFDSFHFIFQSVKRVILEINTSPCLPSDQLYFNFNYQAIGK